MSGSTLNYGFGTKNNWRRWVWNRVAERVYSPRDSICVYLPSQHDLDRPIALAKGFRPLNLIGVERDNRTLKLARSAGSLVAEGDFFDCVEAVSKSRRVDVVLADLCCGFTPAIAQRFSNMLIAPGLNRCVFAVNLLRGRDPQSNDHRALLTKHFPEIGKHRAKMFLVWCISNLVVYARGADTAACIRDINRAMSRASIAEFSYRSTSGQIFDSAVLRNPFEMVDLKFNEFKSSWMRHQADYCARTSSPEKDAAARSVAAVMAHRTRRQWVGAPC